MAGFWKHCRTTFRWCRFTIWFLVLLILGSALWLNRVGVPDFLKTRLVLALRENGVRLEFSRMRLNFVRGLVADDVRVGGAQGDTNSVVTAREVQLQLDFSALWHRRLQLDGIAVRDGTFTLAASPTNAFVFTNLQTELRFQPNDTWTLDHFHTSFDDVQILLSGEIAHASEIRNWKIFNGRKSGGATNENQAAGNSLLAPLLQQISGSLDRIHLRGGPRLDLTVQGDARDIHSVTVRLDATVPDARTPWFSARDLQFSARLTAPVDAPTNSDPALGFWNNLQPLRLEWIARAGDLRIENLEADTLAAAGEWRAPELSINKFSGQLASGHVAARAELNVTTHALTFTNDSSFDPHLLARWFTKKARDHLADILWTRPPALHVNGSLTLPPWTNSMTSWPDQIAPTVRLNGKLAFTNAVANGTPLDFLKTQFSYAKEFWKLSGFELAQGRTDLRFDGDADETTQNFDGHLRGAVTGKSVQPFLTASNLTRNFDRFHFSEPLDLDVTVRGNWRDWNLLGVNGSLALTNFSVATLATNHLAVDFIRTRFSYTNQFWNLNSFELAQGRTRLDFDGKTSDATENFTGDLRGTFALESLLPCLTSNVVQGLAIVQLPEPVAFAVNAAGNWRDFSTLTVTGRVALTNFVVREQTIDSVTANLFYTNRQLNFFQPHLSRINGSQTMRADAVTLDFPHGRIYFTNGFSIADPMFVVRCIGPKTAKLIEPYHFPGLPVATVNGCSPMRDVKGGHDLDDADLTFVILKPTPFQWSKLRSSGMTGKIRWHGQYLDLTNIAGEFYGGTATGFANFDFTPHSHDADYQFAFAVANTDLPRLIADVADSSNKLAGRLTGYLTVTNASTETLQSWNGFGHVSLSKGLLWNTPIFGLASKALNLFAPGLGNSQATDASADFGITNGVVRSDSLEMHTTTMRLQYNGTLDLTGNVNARVTAQLLRNAPLVGQIVSTVFWPVSKIFECQVTGTLGNPKITPIYVPFSNILLAPLHPIRSFQELISPASTNAPAK